MSAEPMLQVANDSSLATGLGKAAHSKAKQLYTWPAERPRLLMALESAVSAAAK